MEHLRGNSSNYGSTEEDNFMWVVIFGLGVIAMLAITYICKLRHRPIVIFEYTTRPGIDTGTSTAINVDQRPFMMQLSSPKRRSTSPRDPAEMV